MVLIASTFACSLSVDVTKAVVNDTIAVVEAIATVARWMKGYCPIGSDAASLVAVFVVIKRTSLVVIECVVVLAVVDDLNGAVKDAVDAVDAVVTTFF
mmetsp:Transcript_49760/g.106612  ORF Transcript_49760/g.106612 Transcript_49760/m.106612 type:complete len:98 (+) Transcript_49760:445-738(+)